MGQVVFEDLMIPTFLQSTRKDRIEDLGKKIQRNQKVLSVFFKKKKRL